MTGIEICGVGSYLPANIVKNEDFTGVVETSDEWIRTRTGISSRHVGNGETMWRMGAIAAKRAMEMGKVTAKEIDMVLVTTVTPDYMTPSASCIIQGELGASNALCIDINCACAAFVYALDMAWRYLCCGDVKNVLIISSELLTRMVNYEDRSTCVLFGDGAGACIVRASNDKPFAACLGADGSGYSTIFSKNQPHETPFTTLPAWEDEITKNPLPPNKMFMDGRETYKFATRVMPESIRGACLKAGINPAELDWIVPHQANVRIVQTAMKNLGLPIEKAYVNIDHTGNTSSASIPLALDEMSKNGLLKRGDKIAVTGFGGGLIYGGAVFVW